MTKRAAGHFAESDTKLGIFGVRASTSVSLLSRSVPLSGQNHVKHLGRVAVLLSLRRDEIGNVTFCSFRG